MSAQTEASGNNFTLLRLTLALMFGRFKLLYGMPRPPFPFDLAETPGNVSLPVAYPRTTIR